MIRVEIFLPTLVKNLTVKTPKLFEQKEQMTTDK